MKKNYTKDVLDVAVNSVFTGLTVGVINQSPLNSNIKSASSGLLGIALLKDTSKKLKL